MSGNRPSGSLRARSTTLSSDVDMNSSINASAMFPQLRLTPARAAFARPGPHATAFPDVNAPMQPSDSLVPVGRRSGRPSPAAYPGAEVLVLHRRTGASANRCNAGDISTPAPHKPALSRGETRGSQVPGPSSSCVPCSTTPPGATAPRPLSVRSLLPSGCLTPWAPWKADSFRGYMAHGPTRSRTYASPNPLPFPAQGSLPAGRAHPWPGGFRTRWMTNKVS